VIEVEMHAQQAGRLTGGRESKKTCKNAPEALWFLGCLVDEII
jgi:hypothetical protein